MSEVTQSCLTLCNSMDCSPPSFPIHGILQARKLEWVAISFSRGSSHLRDRTCHFCIGRKILYDSAIWEALFYIESKSVCPSVVSDCNPMDCSPPGSSVHGILQARKLEWVAISFSRGFSQPRHRTWVSHISGTFLTN